MFLLKVFQYYFRIFLDHVDGTFVVRKSQHGGVHSPYTLTLHFQKRCYNLNIRKISDRRYALGKRKNNEMVFGTVNELINYHKSNKLLLMDNTGQVKGQTLLTNYPRGSYC